VTIDLSDPQESGGIDYTTITDGDVVVIDLPLGTGDVVLTTPQEVSVDGRDRGRRDRAANADRLGSHRYPALTPLVGRPSGKTAVGSGKSSALRSHA